MLRSIHMSVKFIKNAEHVQLVHRSHNNNSLNLIVNDDIVELSPRHPFCKTASLTGLSSIESTLQNAHFVIETVKGHKKLKEYRDSSYNGFMQSDEFIQRFANDSTLLQRASDNFKIAEYGVGGDFKLHAGFVWSAFSKNLKTTVEVVRLICQNGLTARNKMFEREVPIINLFDHHLDIASRQLIEISKTKITNRLLKMGREHSLVKDVNLVAGHISRRLKDDSFNDRLIKLDGVISEFGDISKYYTKNSINNGIAAALPSPISRYDLYNIITELNTHTHEIVDSTKSSLDKIGTSLIFPTQVDGVISERNVKQTTFGSPEKAFFG